jgi:hypothetical protein
MDSHNFVSIVGPVRYLSLGLWVSCWYGFAIVDFSTKHISWSNSGNRGVCM